MFAFQKPCLKVDGKRVDAKRQHFNRGSDTKDDKLFVGGVPSDFADGALADFFSPYGMVCIDRRLFDDISFPRTNSNETHRYEK